MITYIGYIYTERSSQAGGAEFDALIICLFFFFFSLKKQKNQDKDHPSAGHSVNTCNSQGWRRLKPEFRDSIQVFTQVSKHISRKLESEAELGIQTQRLQNQDAGIPSRA